MTVVKCQLNNSLTTNSAQNCQKLSTSAQLNLLNVSADYLSVSHSITVSATMIRVHYDNYSAMSEAKMEMQDTVLTTGYIFGMHLSHN